MGIFDFLNKLQDKTRVGIFVSPQSVLEIVHYDIETRRILKYAYQDLSYDLISRQIEDIKAFETAIFKMYGEFDIPLKTPAILTLPTVYISHQVLPITLNQEEVNIALISDADTNYIFKKNEPIVSWEEITVSPETGTQYLLYTAIQKEEIEKVKEALVNVGINLQAIDSSYTSLLRGLSASGILTNEVSEGLLWCTMLVTPNNFAIISIMGNKVIDISETPIATKSFNHEDTYTNISAITMEVINSKSPDHIVIVSESNEIFAEKLQSYIKVDCKISCVEINNRIKEPLFYWDESVMTQPISPETVGSACWLKTDVPISFDFLSTGNRRNSSGVEVKLLGKSIFLTPQIVQYAIIALIGFFTIFIGSSYFILTSISGAMEQSLQELNSKSTNLKSSLDQKSEVPTLSTSDIITGIYDKNGKIVQSVNSIGGVIPEKLWIEEFKVEDSLNATIVGKAYSVEDIITYYQNLLRSAKFENLKIVSIKVIKGSEQNSAENNNGVNIISQENTNSSLPTLPSLSGLSNLDSQKYYKFTFGNPSAVNTNQAAAPATDANGQPLPPEATGQPGAVPQGPMSQPPSAG